MGANHDALVARLAHVDQRVNEHDQVAHEAEDAHDPVGQAQDGAGDEVVPVGETDVVLVAAVVAVQHAVVDVAHRDGGLAVEAEEKLVVAHLHRLVALVAAVGHPVAQLPHVDARLADRDVTVVSGRAVALDFVLAAGGAVGLRAVGPVAAAVAGHERAVFVALVFETVAFRPPVALRRHDQVGRSLGHAADLRA